MGRILNLDLPLKINWRVKSLVHKLLDILFVNPRCAKPDTDFRSLQINRLCCFQRTHIMLKSRISLRSCAGFPQFFTHVAGQVFVCRNVLHRCAWQAVAASAQVGQKLIFGHSRELKHIGNIHSCPFGNGYRKGFLYGIHMVYHLVLPDRALIEHIRFVIQFALLVQLFQRT